MKLALLGLFAIACTARAGSLDRFTECGRYRVQGTMDQRDDTVFVRVFAETSEETRLTVSSEPNPAASAFLHKKVEVIGVIDKKIEKYRGRINVVQYNRALPDPLDPSQGDGFWLQEKTKCLK